LISLITEVQANRAELRQKGCPKNTLKISDMVVTHVEVPEKSPEALEANSVVVSEVSVREFGLNQPPSQPPTVREPLPAKRSGKAGRSNKSN
jgi:hypothetical protein